MQNRLSLYLKIAETFCWYHDCKESLKKEENVLDPSSTPHPLAKSGSEKGDANANVILVVKNGTKTTQ